MPGRPSRIRRAARRVVPLRVRRSIGIPIDRYNRRLRQAAFDVLGRAPFLRAREHVYDDDFYDVADPPTTELYELVVDSLIRLRSPQSVADVGCGTGLMLTRFAERGVSIRGVEGSRAAIRRSGLGDRIVRANLERGVPHLGRFDLCLCIEVAEHLGGRSARRLVEGLTRLSDVVVFTAAQPGQPGISHVNLRPKSYWQRLFAERGFAPSPLERQVREAIAGIPQPEYIHANLMVFERTG